jgi:hypothetical protein
MSLPLIGLPVPGKRWLLHHLSMYNHLEGSLTSEAKSLLARQYPTVDGTSNARIAGICRESKTSILILDDAGTNPTPLTRDDKEFLICRNTPWSVMRVKD